MQNEDADCIPVLVFRYGEIMRLTRCDYTRLNASALAAVRTEEKGRTDFAIAVRAFSQADLFAIGWIATGHDFFVRFAFGPRFDFFGAVDGKRV